MPSAGGAVRPRRTVRGFRGLCGLRLPRVLRLGPCPGKARQQGAVEVDGDDAVRAKRPAHGDGHWIDEATVDVPAILAAHGRKHRRQGHGCPDGIERRALREPLLPAERHLRRHAGKAQGHVLDGQICRHHVLGKRLPQASRRDQPLQQAREVDIRGHARAAEGAGPVPDGGKAAGGICGADDRAD